VGALVLTPSYDEKAGFAVLAGFAGLALCAADGVRRRLPRARLALALALAAIALEAWQGGAFLDNGYYLGMAAVFAVLVASQVLALARSRTQERAAEGRAETLQEALTRRDRATASIRDGTKTHRVPTAEILWLQAADDYCEVHLADGRKLLSTLALSQTLETLPGDFVRVHKSYAVNAEHVVTIGPRPGGRRSATLSDGSTIPVGRTFEPALARLTALA
jgi:DNA-binding LytR/AlgR family response regulator